MRRLYITLVYCFLLIVFISAENSVEAIFRMPKQIDKQNSISKEYFSDSEILLDNKECLSGISISGKSILYSDTSLVRVLLIDASDNSYLILDDYYLTHDNDNFNNIAIETAEIDSVLPNKIKIIVRDASLQLDVINFSYWTNQMRNERQARRLLNIQRQQSQEEYIINKWNEYNATHQKCWIAGKTTLSNLTYSQKKDVFGAIDDSFVTDGLEYYVGGYFVVHSNDQEIETEAQSDNLSSNSNYVESFDWRNRHGKNWMTSVKSQILPQNTLGNGGCWAFAACATVESAINLQFNRLLDYDLSEQELGSCTSGSLHTGGNSGNALSYIKNNGIVTEECMPFENADTVSCSKKCDTPNDVIHIANNQAISSNEETLKSILINKGPIPSGFSNGHTNHAMCLCGYGIIHEGDIIESVPYTSHAPVRIEIEAGNELIGKTYWIYKNSYGVSSGINGYFYAVYEKASTMYHSYSISYPITSEIYSQNDVLIEDADGDGYYFWGLGTKPQKCPVCCPDIPDGDDANNQVAQMDVYGNFAPYTFPYDDVIINTNTNWIEDDTICGNIIVTNNATLEIASDITLNPAAKIMAQSGSTIIVNGGYILNANVIIENSASLILKNHAVLQLNTNDSFDVKAGGNLLIEQGDILPK